MIGALQIWRRSGRPAAVAVSAAVAAVVLASSAAAATPAWHHGDHHHHAGGSGGSSPLASTAGGSWGSSPLASTGGHSLSTLFGSVRVFTAASYHAAVKGKVTGHGTRVSVLCWTTGAFYKDTPVWYEISSPFSGYVSAFSMMAHYSPAVGLPHCLSPAFREQFNALEANLRIRKSPAISASVLGHLGGVGSNIKVDCYVKGTPVLQDPIWYHAVAPVHGYVTGRLLNTGGDPAPGVPRC
jgi:hypothetical protein